MSRGTVRRQGRGRTPATVVMLVPRACITCSSAGDDSADIWSRECVAITLPKANEGEDCKSRAVVSETLPQVTLSQTKHQQYNALYATEPQDGRSRGLTIKEKQYSRQRAKRGLTTHNGGL